MIARLRANKSWEADATKFDDPGRIVGEDIRARLLEDLYSTGLAARNLKTCQLHFADKLCQRIFSP